MKITPKYTLNVRGELIDLSTPRVMGILNCTPDSFFADSRKQTEAEIARRAVQIAEEGATFIDVGAFSTRPGASVVSEGEECRRLKNALEIVRRETPHMPISVDTYRPLVARRCVEEWGAHIINDVSEGGITGIVNTPINEKGSMFQTVAQLQVPYIFMSVRATLKDMMTAFAREVQLLRDLGAKDIVLDPGYGFGKTLEENYNLLNNADKLHELGFPILVGVSRKSMIWKPLNTSPQKALNGTTVLHTLSLLKGANILRVHDVKEAMEAITLCELMEEA